ncbi:DinB family protein [Georgenia alba]|uniref:DinB family protein n=1 Tax=Georgenia alba TaxID=2233858 RepID=A0ABW2QC74_9MICO
MATFSGSDELRGAVVKNADLRGAQFRGCDLSGVVVRGSELQQMEIDSPWIFDGDNVLLVNGVDVLPYVDAELNRRFPGRSEQRAADPDGLRSAWAKVESTWAATLARAAAMPDGTVEASVDGEWSLTQTLRHLIMATDMWLGKGILGKAEPFHPVGLLDTGTAREGGPDGLQTAAPSYEEVLRARAGRQTMVRDFLAAATADLLAEPRPNPHDPDHDETVLSCLHTILEEEWEHHRYAARDLDAIAAGRV